MHNQYARGKTITTATLTHFIFARFAKTNANEVDLLGEKTEMLRKTMCSRQPSTSLRKQQNCLSSFKETTNEHPHFAKRIIGNKNTSRAGFVFGLSRCDLSNVKFLGYLPYRTYHTYNIRHACHTYHTCHVCPCVHFLMCLIVVVCGNVFSIIRC